MKLQKKMEFCVSEDDPDVAYLTLPDHPGAGVVGAVAKQIRLLDILSYKGVDIYIDLDVNGKIIGLEILG